MRFLSARAFTNMCQILVGAAWLRRGWGNKTGFLSITPPPPHGLPLLGDLRGSVLIGTVSWEVTAVFSEILFHSLCTQSVCVHSYSVLWVQGCKHTKHAVQHHCSACKYEQVYTLYTVTLLTDGL